MFQRVFLSCLVMFSIVITTADNGTAQSVFRIGAWCFVQGAPLPIYQLSPPTGPWRVYNVERDKLLNLGLNYFIACTGLNAEDALVFMGDSLGSAPAPKISSPI
jgi:hypothetical protein